MRYQWVLYLLFFSLLHCAGNTGLLDSEHSTVDGRIAFVGPGDFASFKFFLMRPDGEGLMRLTSEKGAMPIPPGLRMLAALHLLQTEMHWEISIFISLIWRIGAYRR